MEAQALKGESRADLKRTRVKKLRTEGNVPAVLYGNSLEPRPLAIAEAEFAKVIKASASQNILVQLDVAGDSQVALVQEIQRHPLSGAILHVDFRAVSEDKPVIVSVPVEPKGEPYGVKNEGGLLEHVLFQTRADSAYSLAAEAAAFSWAASARAARPKEMENAGIPLLPMTCKVSGKGISPRCMVWPERISETST